MLDTECIVLVFVPTELEKQMKIENLFVTWQQRSAQSNMPISVSITSESNMQTLLNICNLNTIL